MLSSPFFFSLFLVIFDNPVTKTPGIAKLAGNVDAIGRRWLDIESHHLQIWLERRY